MGFRAISVFSILLVLAAPAAAIVVGYDPVGSGIFGDPNSPDYLVGYNQVTDGVNLNGEVMLNVFYNDGGAATCTGSVLSDGESVLTAAHCIAPTNPFGSGLLTPTLVQVYFDQGGSCGWYCGAYMVTDVANFFVDPSWVANNGTLANGDDLAVVRLDAQAPPQDAGYSLYTGPLTSSDILEIAGLGQSGQGGIDGGNYPAGILRQGQNTYIGTCADIFGVCSANSLISQFSASSTVPFQVEIGPGDSGGASFLNGQLVGVHSFFSCDTPNCSINGNTYFGDTYVGGANAAWIESVEANVPEPASVILVGLGAFALLAARRARRLAA